MRRNRRSGQHWVRFVPAHKANPEHLVIPHGLRAHVAETSDGYACLLIEDIATGVFLDALDLQEVIRQRSY